MNIFALDKNPKIAAIYHCDQHLNKMILESCQMLMTPYWLNLNLNSRKEIKANPNIWMSEFASFPRRKQIIDDLSLTGVSSIGDPYGIGYKNHPCTKWVMESKQNWLWLLELAYALIEEKKFRTNKGHSCELILDWFSIKHPILPEKNLTDFFQAFPVEYKELDPVEGYKNCYHFTPYYKGWFPTWTKRQEPIWYTRITPNEFENSYTSRLHKDHINIIKHVLLHNDNQDSKTLNKLVKKLIKKPCEICPFNDGVTEAATLGQVYGCIKSQFDILKLKKETNNNFACYTNANLICTGITRESIERNLSIDVTSGMRAVSLDHVIKGDFDKNNTIIID